MSVSDPLLKDLKGRLLSLVQSVQVTKNCDEKSAGLTPVTDTSPELAAFCDTLEEVLRKGLKPQLSSLGFGRPGDIWTWMSAFGDQRKGATFGYEFAVSSVRKDPKVTTNVGRMRLLIRTCLSHRCLFKPIELVVRNPALVSRWYRNWDSIVGHEILGEILLSLVLQVGQLVFHLDVTNSFFLDESWLIPPRLKFEFVPSKELGICVMFVSEKAIVVGLKEYGVAAESDGIAIGDVIEELNGELVTSSMKGRLSSLLKRSVGRPIAVSVIKPKYPGTEKPYPPASNLKRHTKIDPAELERLQFTTAPTVTDGKNSKCGPYLSPSLSTQPVTKGTGYPVMFVGFVAVGERGDFRMIEGAVEVVLRSSEPGTQQPVLLECQEMNVRIASQSTGKTLLRHTFMEISSCGGSHGRPNYFGFIAGDASCNMAKNFTCFVFQCSDTDRIAVILQNIAQGFQRTHFVV